MSLPPDPARAAPASAALDGLRGLAALLVVASHAGNMGLHLVPGLSFAGAGKTGVFLFFVISAYLLTGQWLAHAARTGRAPWQDRGHLLDYLWRRFLRIYPLYTLVLLAGWALAPRGLGVALDGPAVLRHLLLLEGRDLYWSVPVEFAYYLVIPLLAAWLLTRWPAAVRLLGVLLAAALVGWFYAPGLAPPNADRMPWYLPVFTCGSLAAWWVHEQRDRPPHALPRRVTTMLDLAALVLLVLGLPAVLLALHWIDSPDALHRAFWAWGLFWGAIVVGVVRGALPQWRRVLAWPGLGACGRWCFGIYLLHMPVLLLVQPLLVRKLGLPAPAGAWVALLLALALAALAHRWVEKPAMRRGRGLRPQPTPA